MLASSVEKPFHKVVVSQNTTESILMKNPMFVTSVISVSEMEVI